MILRSSISTACCRPVTRLPRKNLSLYSPSTKPFFVTTPIFYVNASPHIGHLHSLVLTDVLARFAKLRSPQRKVIFTTGTDEHGLKIQQAAKAQGVEEGEFCARVSQRFRDLADRANVGYTDFIRTAEPRHYRAVEHFWNRLVESGDVYKGTHSGWYSISDECFYSEKQIRQDESGKIVAIETGNEVVWEEEENWKFRLPRYRERLLSWADRPESIHPLSMKSFVTSQMASVEDLSISRPRSRVRWGVPVPGDPNQTIYVWVDALINYLTVLGYPASADGWPVDVHVVGKDIIKFHAVHWPALLMSAGLEPPRQVLSHAHWTMGKFKMSKSRGNVVDPIAAMDKYGPEPIRWYLMREGGSLPDDSDFNLDQLNANYSVLAQQFGNLLNRVTSPKIVQKMGSITSHHPLPDFDAALSSARDRVEGFMSNHQITKACEVILNLIADANKLVTDMRPWEANNDATIPVLYAYQALRISGILAQPFMPVKSSEMLDRLAVDPTQRTWNDATWTGRSGFDALALKEQLSRSLPGSLFPRLNP
ncbi:putative methionine-tRNA ligase [Papiliotrema laurentii]|uniref:Methionine--tRNA ligase, mitochondrial n=1 Tax=Papiliotrema laurentii TaxID=5418 RepID=A0AAD9FQR6_PAPLA|nr:putative methionine-tRNA ligase [Papiliotrema laurentii]